MFASIQKSSFLVALAVLVLSAPRVMAQQFVTVDVPGATFSIAGGINNAGQIVGLYNDSAGVGHGFSLIAGVYTTIDYPSASATAAISINDLGQIAGNYTDANKITHGFILTNGTFSTLDDPAFADTYPAFIDDSGNICGLGIDSAGSFHGFQWVQGVFTTIDFPGANFTQVLGANFLGGSLVGIYNTSFPDGTYHGFTDIGGVFTTLDYPGAAGTQVSGVNDGGQLLGLYYLPSQNVFSQSFLLSSNVFSTIDFPGAAYTQASSLNDSGEVVGDWIDGNNNVNGYLMTGGPFAYVSNPAAGNVLEIDQLTGLQIAAISLASAGHLAATPDQKSVYVTSANTVALINTATNTVTNTIAVGTGAFAVAITPDGAFAYVTNQGSNNVSVIATASNTVVATVPVGTRPQGIAITPDGASAYVANQSSGSVSVISTANNEVVATITGIPNADAVSITPNGASVYVSSDQTSNALVTVISTASNTIATTIPVGNVPKNVAITPDGSTAYVNNQQDSTVSVINIAANVVIATISSGGTKPGWVWVTPDGSSAWVLNRENIAEISTATNTVISTLPFLHTWLGSAIFLGVPPTSQPLMQQLSPTQLNVFNYGPHNYKVQYPPRTSFKNVNMTTTAVQLTQAQFQSRVAGTAFANAACIVYMGESGFCEDYQVTCSDQNGQPIPCPSASNPITVQTTFDSAQSIINPAYLTTPIGTNQWTNVFDSLYQQRIDPTVKGKTSGFSEFIAVDLGAGNQQGQATFFALHPLEVGDPRVFSPGSVIPTAFNLKSVVTGKPVTDAVAGLTVVFIKDANGKPQSTVILSLPNAFQFKQSSYRFRFSTNGYAPGLYSLTIFGNAFPSHQIEFQIQSQ